MGLNFNKKKAKQAKYLQTVLQLGNFLIKKEGDGEYTYIRISTVDGNWGMDFREDTMKYAWVLMLSSDEKYHEALRGWIVTNYHLAMCNPDAQLLENTIKELYALNERNEERAENNSKMKAVLDKDNALVNKNSDEIVK